MARWRSRSTGQLRFALGNYSGYVLERDYQPGLFSSRGRCGAVGHQSDFQPVFPGKKDFFLDGADYFDTFRNLVYTRNIASPEYGAKITGKNGPHTFGFLAANDESTSFIVPRSLSSRIATLADEKSDVAIARYRFDIFQNSTVGALVTNREGIGYSNRVSSLDTTLRPTEQDTIYLQAMHSESEYPQQIQDNYGQAAELSDNSLAIEYQHNDRNWDWRFGHYDWGKDFRADLGFINRVDYVYQVRPSGIPGGGAATASSTAFALPLTMIGQKTSPGCCLRKKPNSF